MDYRYGGYYFANDNYFYKGDFTEGMLTGKGIFFFCDSQDMYMGEVKDG